ncbi:MAG: hypothetical protein ACXW3D_10415, partial [Caulobacteraceae bacterium]
VWLSPRIAKAAEAAWPCPSSVLHSTVYREPSLVFLAHGRVKFAGAPETFEAVRRNPACALVLVDSSEEAGLLSRVSLKGFALTKVADFKGFNYSKGDKLSLVMYKTIPQL